jgi:hypothetical protein
MPKAKKKKIVRREWTKEDNRILKSLARQKLGVAKISKKLKRTAAATAVQAMKQGVSLSMRG